MRRFIYTVIVLFIATISVFAKRNIAPGEWQTIRSYNGITSIIPSKEKVYVVANGGMYSYDKKTKEVKPLSTLDGLSASAIEMVEYVESTKTLFIIHSDMTIDLVVDGVTFSDESIKDSEISGKKVNNLKVDGDNVYISLDAGIVVYNTKKREVSDTYIIGNDGEYEVVYQTIVFNNDIYALMADRSHCSQRKIRVCKEGKNANDFNAWEPVALPITCPVDSVVVKTMDCSSGHVLLLTSEGLYALLEDGSWVDVSPRGIVPDTIQVYKNRLTAITCWQVMAFHKDNLGDMKYRECWSKIAVYDVDEDVVWHDNGDGLRIADMSVDELKATVSEPIKFDGPSQNDYYSLEVVDGEIYLTGNDGYNTPVVVDYSKEGKWYNLRDSLKDDNLRFFRSGHVIAVDPTDKNHVMVPTWWGIYEFYKDSLLRVHNKENASFFETSGTNCTYVECVWFDEENNVIATNPSSSGYLLHAMNKDGEWTALKHNNLTGQRYARRHLKTKSGIDIVVFEYKPIGLGFVDMNGTTFDASDDKTKLVASFKYMEDGVMETFQPSYVFSVEEDLKGDIWIATDQGPLIMKNVKGVFDGKESYVRPKITREDDSRYADYLLASDKVRKIQVDGKNRKWIATEGNGLFLVSASGDKILENFTTKNSPLSSNAVMDIVYEKETGVLYIMTDTGLLMYATDSSFPEDDFDNVTVYPNPVRSDYDGDLEIKGLMDESNVRITDQRGMVIENGISKGGTYRFSARRSDGSRLPTGVYNVFITTAADDEGMVETKHLKFAIIR
ncbi:MAG: hypothetical protein J6Y11_11950 [Paludibacteraceae bacterium]|nr:hypothetical protein [Paludibacteraceae bacterium]